MSNGTSVVAVHRDWTNSFMFGAAGCLVVGAAVRLGTPRLGAVATGLAFVGFVAATYPGPVAAIAASRAAGLDSEQALGLIGLVDGQPLGRLSSVLFIGVPAGILLLGIAALVAARRERFPLWTAILLTAATPLVLVGGFVSTLALGLAWVVVSAAFGAAGLVFARR